MKLLIVETKTDVALALVNAAEKLGYQVIDCVNTSKRALELIITDDPDLILIDIELERKNEASELARSIYNKLHTPFIFVISGDVKNVVEIVKDNHPNGILIYSEDLTNIHQHLGSTVELALFNNVELYSRNTVNNGNNYLGSNSDVQNGLFIKIGDIYKKVAYDKILWLEGDDNYTIVYTQNRKFAIKKVLKFFDEILPSNKFFRVHKSYIVNLDKITALNYKSVHLDDKIIPLSRNNRNKLLVHLKII